MKTTQLFSCTLSILFFGVASADLLTGIHWPKVPILETRHILGPRLVLHHPDPCVFLVSAGSRNSSPESHEVDLSQMVPTKFAEDRGRARWAGGGGGKWRWKRGEN